MAKGDMHMEKAWRYVLAGAYMFVFTGLGAEAPARAAGSGTDSGADPAQPQAVSKLLPAPPFAVDAPKGWTQEHIAFTPGWRAKVVGGPARWAVGGSGVTGGYPSDQAGRLYTGAQDSDVWMWFIDKGRRVWRLEKGMIWPVAGSDDLGYQDGPGAFSTFTGGGFYGGGIGVGGSSGNTILMGDGGLRKVFRKDDGTWHIETVAGKGDKAPAEGLTISEIKKFGRMTVDAKGNIIWSDGGNLWKAGPDGGRITCIITRAKAQADLAAVYAKKWPGAAVPNLLLGSGEGPAMLAGPDGAIYIGGRCWPQISKVTADGTFVPLANYSPGANAIKGHWGTGDPALRSFHCPMMFGLTLDGKPVILNEIPAALSRIDDDNHVSVLKSDGTFSDSCEAKEVYSTQNIYTFARDNSISCGAPRYGAWCYVRMKEAK